jgi:hypothetical protein
MSAQICCRCHAEQYIPTHQYVKFDATVYYLCSECWELFRNWYFRGPKAVYSAEKEAA